MSTTSEDIYRALLLSKRRALEEPLWFFETVLNCTGHSRLEDWQLLGVEAVADVHRKLKGLPTVTNHEGLNRITVKSCHGPGKTHWLGLIMHWWNFCFYGKVVCTAPKEKQLKTRLWPRYRKILRNSVASYQHMVTVNALDIKIMDDEDWGCIAETASDPENMAGYHDTPQLFLVDEASARVLDPMFPVIEGTLTTPGSVLVEIGNPTRTSGEFWASHNKRGTKELYYQMHIRPEDSRFVDPKWVEAMQNKYGKDSPVVKVRVLGEFADTEENQLVAMEWIEESVVEEFKEDGSLWRLRVTVDVADGGEDETVITVGRLYDTTTCLVKQHSFSFPSSRSPVLAAEAAMRIADEYGYDIKRGDDIVVDSLGVGAGTAGTIIETGKYNVVTYKGGESSDDPSQWRNRRVQSYLVLRNELRDGNIQIAEDFCSEQDFEEFIAQLTSIHTKPGIERVEDLETKQDMKRQGIKSPDRADSVAMLFATQTPVMGQVESIAEVFGDMEMAEYDASLI